MIYYYGGAFDPITRAHINIIKAINKHLSSKDEFYVGVVKNDEKNYNVDQDMRISLVQSTLDSVFRGNSPEVIKQCTRMFAFLKEQFTGKDDEVVIVIGEDEWNSLAAGKWIEYKALLDTYKFIVVKRFSSDQSLKKAPSSKFPGNILKVITVEDSDNVSSTAIRDIFYRNPMTIYTDVKFGIVKKTFEDIKENKLYKQNNANYKKEEAEFIEKYKVEKKKHGWAEPSVTADILAYNGNQVLLIRRGNFPYKWHFCLPGGFFDLSDPDLNHTAAREFKEETTIDIEPDKFEQIKAYSHMFDPRLRIIDVAFAVRVNAKDMKKAVGSDDAIEARWFDIDDLPPLGFHHRQIIEDWLKQRNN